MSAEVATVEEQVRREFDEMRVKSIIEFGGDSFLFGFLGFLGLVTTIGLVNIGAMINHYWVPVITAAVVMVCVGVLTLNPLRFARSLSTVVVYVVLAMMLSVIFYFETPLAVIFWLVSHNVFAVYSIGMKRAAPVVLICLLAGIYALHLLQMNGSNVSQVQLALSFAVPFINLIGFLMMSELRLSSSYEKIIGANKEYESTAQRMDIILENIGSGIVGTDEAGVVNYANKVFQGLTGFEQQAIIGRNIAGLVLYRDSAGEVIRSFDNPLKKAVAAKTQLTEQSITIESKNGQQQRLLATVLHINDSLEKGSVIIFNQVGVQHG